MSMEIPRREDAERKEASIEASIEASRIIEEYPDRLNKAVSIHEETVKIMEEEERGGKKYSDYMKIHVPLIVMSTIREKGKKVIFRNNLSKYAKEAKGSAGYRQDLEEKINGN